MPSAADLHQQRAAHEQELADLQDRIDLLEADRAALEGRIRWMTSKIEGGRRTTDAEPPASSAKPVDLTSAVIAFVRSQQEPVTAPDVVAHLRSMEIPFNEKSISVLHSRHACRADALDGTKPLRNVASGKYAGNDTANR